MRNLRVLVAALAAVVALVVAGCGSATNDYRGEVSKVQEKYLEDLNTTAQQMSPALAGGDPTAAVPMLDSIVVTTTKLAEEVDALEAPEESQALADALVSSYRSLGDAATELKTAIEAEDSEAYMAALQAYSAAESANAEAVKTLNDAE